MQRMLIGHYYLLCVCVSVQVGSVVIKFQKCWFLPTVGCGLNSAVAATGLERDSQQSMKVCVLGLSQYQIVPKR